jgi:hypothetical protein
MSAKATSMVNHLPRAGTSPFKVGYGTSDGSKRLGNTMCVGWRKKYHQTCKYQFESSFKIVHFILSLDVDIILTMGGDT